MPKLGLLPRLGAFRENDLRSLEGSSAALGTTCSMLTLRSGIVYANRCWRSNFDQLHGACSVPAPASVSYKAPSFYMNSIVNCLARRPSVALAVICSTLWIGCSADDELGLCNAPPLSTCGPTTMGEQRVVIGFDYGFNGELAILTVDGDEILRQELRGIPSLGTTLVRRRLTLPRGLHELSFTVDDRELEQLSWCVGTDSLLYLDLAPCGLRISSTNEPRVYD